MKRMGDTQSMLSTTAAEAAALTPALGRSWYWRFS